MAARSKKKERNPAPSLQAHNWAVGRFEWVQTGEGERRQITMEWVPWTPAQPPVANYSTEPPRGANWFIFIGSKESILVEEVLGFLGFSTETIRPPGTLIFYSPLPGVTGGLV